ncbi:MAG: squalene/phytoene synthase family protein, partial [Gemmatimonadota bacterium]|nr:squalene/phytoene synthase family protein [Gemmatimonadota bacterium]
DLGVGLIYSSADRMAFHGVTGESLLAMKARLQGGGRVDRAYVALLEELMARADSAYAAAYEGMPFLPARFRRPVAVAAQVYRGIHDRVRANGYDNLNRRAYTTLRGKIILGRQGLGRLARAPGHPEVAG